MVAQYIRELLKNLISLIVKIELVANLIVAVVMVLFWILVAFIVFKITKFFMFKTKNLEQKIEGKETKEQMTVRRLITNIVKSMFVFWIVIMILKELGIDIMPLLAGAGVLAFAVGFGAQEVIKDVISGMFLIVEKTVTIDDLVEINDYKGTVVDVGIRRTKLVTWKNELVTLNNGDIKTVVNHSTNNSLAVVEFNLDPKFDINILYNKEFIDFLSKFKKDNKEVLSKPTLPVIMDLDNAVRFRITMETVTRKQAGIEREFRKELLNYFNTHNITIEIPVIVGYMDNE